MIGMKNNGGKCTNKGGLMEIMKCQILYLKYSSEYDTK